MNCLTVFVDAVLSEFCTPFACFNAVLFAKVLDFYYGVVRHVN